MSGLARYLLQHGHLVKGSDLLGGEQVEKLRLLGVDIVVGEGVDTSRIDGVDVVVYTDAVSLGNKELVYALSSAKTVLSRAELLREICSDFRRVIAVGGSHGKTTCTAMCAHILSAVGVPFSAHIGGEDLSFGNFCFAGNDYFVSEACEYKKNLLKVPADVAILLNVDKDHMECYLGEEDLFRTFQTFCDGAPVSVVCLDDSCGARIGGSVTFSLCDKKADYYASCIRQERERYSFTVVEYGVRVCRVSLKVIGRHNVYNALAAFAAMRSFGFSGQEIKRGLEAFTGVKRRFETVGAYKGAEVICDYAHHPKEIESVVRAARRMVKGKLYVVFQPHTFSRTRALMDEFVKTLKDVHGLMIYKTYPAREPFDEAGDAKVLAGRIGSCLYSDSIYSLRTWLNHTVSDGDCVLFLGAGDIYYLAKYLVR